MIKLYQGDCLEIMDRMIAEGVKVDSVITDPPYAIDYQSHRRKTLYKKIKNDTNLDWLDDFFNKAYNCLKDNTAIYCFCSWHNVDTFKQKIEKYFKIKNILIWVKNNHGSGDLQASYAPTYELIIYANKGRCLIKSKRPEDVLYANKTGNKIHPTQKPVDLLENFIKTSTYEKEIILDPFMGSGSTGVACKNLNRNFIGIELEEEYFNIAEQRIKGVTK